MPKPFQPTHTARPNGRPVMYDGVEPYTRTDGSPTYLHRWLVQCNHKGCTQTWAIRTPTGGNDTLPTKAGWGPYSAAFRDQMRCLEHKRKPRPKVPPAAPPASMSDVQLEDIL